MKFACNLSLVDANSTSTTRSGFNKAKPEAFPSTRLCHHRPKRELTTFSAFTSPNQTRRLVNVLNYDDTRSLSMQSSQKPAQFIAVVDRKAISVHINETNSFSFTYHAEDEDDKTKTEKTKTVTRSSIASAQSRHHHSPLFIHQRVSFRFLHFFYFSSHTAIKDIFESYITERLRRSFSARS
jgi:hypothetical protein